MLRLSCSAMLTSPPAACTEFTTPPVMLSAVSRVLGSPIAVIKWKEIYEGFEAGTDRCEDVSNILERIALKHH